MGAAKSQLSTPNTTPSPTKMPATTGDVAPMARITPISRPRSITLMDIVPARPMPPTAAVRTAITSIR